MARNSYLRMKVACGSCGWDGIRAGTDKPCPKCGGAVAPLSGQGGRTFDHGMKRGAAMAKAKGAGRTFGQDMLNGTEGIIPRRGVRRSTGSKVSPEAFGTKATAGRGSMIDQVFNGKGVSPAGVTFGEIEMDGPTSSGTSIFDPVLCEIAYRWFCPHGGTVLDPFAGGSVRGLVASRLGRRYVGVELRPEQVEANRAQMHIAVEPLPEWRVGDSREIPTLAADVEADMIFSCPPYWNLEVYSDDPADLSTLGAEDFFAAQDAIIKSAVDRLRNDRFAVWVVGDVRDKSGYYVNLPGRSIAAFEAAGARLYNEAILITAAGSLPIRAGKQFTATRKLGKTHQNVLVFCKGDPRKATEACGEVEFGEFADALDEAVGDEVFGEAL